MAHHPTPTALPAGFRRRFPLELSPDEYARLEGAGKIHGSKRAALLAGLASLEERTNRDTRVRRVTATDTKAQAKLTALEAKVAECERALAKATADAHAAAARAKDATEKAKIQIAAATQDTQRANDLREAERETKENAQAELAKLDALFVNQLRCPRCRAFAPSGEWASTSTDKGRLVYHKPCGYHEGGVTR